MLHHWFFCYKKNYKKKQKKKPEVKIEFGSYLAFCPTEMSNLGGFAPLQLTRKAKFYRE